VSNVIEVGQTPNETRKFFRDGGVALRERYARRPEMHLADYDRKMNEVRLALTPRSYIPTEDIPNVCA